jgi:hypothetical protein
MCVRSLLLMCIRMVLERSSDHLLMVYLLLLFVYTKTSATRAMFVYIEICKPQSVKSVFLIPIISLYAGSDTRERQRSCTRTWCRSAILASALVCHQPSMTTRLWPGLPGRCTRWDRRCSSSRRGPSPATSCLQCCCSVPRWRREHDQDHHGSAPILSFREIPAIVMPRKRSFVSKSSHVR